MRKFLMGISLFLSSLFSCSSLVAYDASPPCFRILESNYFEPGALYQALSLHHVIQSQWNLIYQDLAKRSRDIPKIVKDKASRLSPQFWNVLKGDLSIVGPRPVVQEEVTKHLGMKAPKILSVRPGLTGIWQVSGRSDTSYITRIELDEKYVDSHSFLLDLKLIAKTIPTMISSKGAY